MTRRAADLIIMSEERPETNQSSREMKASLSAIRERRLKILVVDDNGAYRQSMSHYLRRVCAATVDEASTGADAVRQLEGGATYDFIFLDLIMPPETGVEIYSELKSIDERANIVMMSAYSNSEEWHRAEASGIELVEKPLQPTRLVEILSRCSGA